MSGLSGAGYFRQFHPYEGNKKEMTKSLAVIPARGGSKRIPRKNIKEFFGKPLIAYSIECALRSGLFDRVIVSTEDKEIAGISKKYGAEVPFFRPEELADDYSGTTDVVEHVLNELKRNGEEYDYECTIYPTAPFLREEFLRKGFDVLQGSDDAVYSFSATSMPYPFQRSFRLTENGRSEMFFPEYYESRSQDLEEAYHDAGQFYWSNLKRLEKHKDDMIFSQISIPVILPRRFVIDIDTQEDWEMAESMMAYMKNGDKVRNNE